MPAELHREDRRCGHCGYALRGLALGANCPECGHPTSVSTADRYDGPLSTAPRAVIHAMIRRTFVTGATWSAALGTPSLAQDRLGPQEAGLWIAGAALAWSVMATWAVRPMRDPYAAWHGLGAGDPLRRGVVVLQWTWIALAGVMLAGAHDVVPEKLVFWVHTFAYLGVISATFAAAELWGRLAIWMRDDLAKRVLDFVPWLVLVSLFSRGLMFIAAILVAVVFLSMLRAAAWSLRHHAEGVERAARKRERERKHWTKVLGRVRRGG